MNEAEVVAQLVSYTNTLLAGVSVLFTIVSAYIAALNYFIGSAGLMARTAAFVFITLMMAMLAVVMLGAAYVQEGLIDRLYEIKELDGLSAAGRAIVANAAPEAGFGALSIDDVVRLFVWAALALIYAALFYMTFLHKWRPDVIPVEITAKKAV